jgi:hypothetical protein
LISNWDILFRWFDPPLFQGEQNVYWRSSRYAPNVIGDSTYTVVCTADDEEGCINGEYLRSGSNQYKQGVWTVSAVPIPAAVWLFGSGLLGLIGIARRKAA